VRPARQAADRRGVAVEVRRLTGTATDRAMRDTRNRIRPVGTFRRFSIWSDTDASGGSEQNWASHAAKPGRATMGMASTANPVVETYSRLARKYDYKRNLRSCWGRAAEKALNDIVIKTDYGIVLDIGCGTGRALARLARGSRPGVQFIGIDPARNMRRLAIRHTKHQPTVLIMDGSFEKIPLESSTVDYLYSIFAFHWTTDPNAATKEMARVLRPGGEMDLFFIGRNNGRELIRATTPIFLKYMGPALLLESARMRLQLTKDEAFRLFSAAFDPSRVSVEESYDTYYDTLQGHWAWWVRIEGQFTRIPMERKEECDQEVRGALRSLIGEKGIPYTIHQLHVRVRRA
jgi:ubiquinone/menaquinone biosynthesis C-methylase UbiE